MEVHARYTLIGLFALAVIGAVFMFVYWIEAGGGLTDRTTYRIRFADPVAGLSKGSAVLFNGVRIGEVTHLALDDKRPSDVEVEVAVDRSAPVRSDTNVGVEFQGLAGAPTVALAGGSPNLPLLADAAREKRVLTAEKNSGQTMTQAARSVLRNIDTVVTQNAEPLRNAIASIDKFTAALARNSDKVDGIIAGLDRLTGGGSKPVARIYELAPATKFAPIAAFPSGVMQIPEPSALARLESDRLQLGGMATKSGELAQWPDLLTRVVQSALLRSFENAGYKRVLGRAPEAAKVDYQLLVDIRRFELLSQAPSKAAVELGARIMKS
ncbi:MAG: MlaD family protein, partial [Hyphomicrobiaceae bacterium]